MLYKMTIAWCAHLRLAANARVARAAAPPTALRAAFARRASPAPRPSAQHWAHPCCACPPPSSAIALPPLAPAHDCMHPLLSCC